MSMTKRKSCCNQAEEIKSLTEKLKRQLEAKAAADREQLELTFKTQVLDFQ